MRHSALFQLARLDDRTLGYLLDCLTSIDCDQLREFPTIPLIYHSGVRYYHDQINDDPWMDVLSILGEHHAALRTGKRAIIDCEDLACWRVAELRVRFGVLTARPVFVRRRVMTPRGVKQFVHILVGGLPGGQLEDPSRIMGMGSIGL